MKHRLSRRLRDAVAYLWVGALPSALIAVALAIIRGQVVELAAYCLAWIACALAFVIYEHLA